MRFRLSRQTAVSAGVFLSACLASMGARANSSEAADVPCVAVVLFFSYQNPGGPAFDAGALHAGCWDRVAAAVHDLGHCAVSRAEIEPIVYKWGVRTALMVSGGFLADVATERSAHELLVCDLMIHSDRLLLCGRSVGTATGQVVWADIEEVQLSPDLAATHGLDGERLFDATSLAARNLLTRWSSRPTRKDVASSLYVLPVRTNGMEESAGRVVICCLLRSLLESPSGGIEDPGVTFARLREVGIDPRRLDSRARPILGGTGTSHTVLICDLVAYELPTDAASARRFDDDEIVRFPTPLPAAALSLRLIDAASGIVTFGATEYLSVPSLRGLFGIAKRVSIIKRVQPVADRLVHAAIQKG